MPPPGGSEPALARWRRLPSPGDTGRRSDERAGRARHRAGDARARGPQLPRYPAPTLAGRARSDDTHPAGRVCGDLVADPALPGRGVGLRQAGEPRGVGDRQRRGLKQRPGPHAADPGRARRHTGGRGTGPCRGPRAGSVAVGAAGGHVDQRGCQCRHPHVCRHGYQPRSGGAPGNRLCPVLHAAATLA